MPPVRSLIFKRHVYIIAVILLLSEIMPICSRCVLKKLVYIIIAALFSRQPSSYSKCTKSNMRLSCNIRLVSNTECAFLFYLSLSQLLSRNTQQYTALYLLKSSASCYGTGRKRQLWQTQSSRDPHVIRDCIYFLTLLFVSSFPFPQLQILVYRQSNRTGRTHPSCRAYASID